MTMQNGDRWLRTEKARMEQERQDGVVPTPIKLSARELAAKFGFMRRKKWFVSHVRNKIDELDLVMNPDFGNVHIDTRISIQWESDSDSLVTDQKSDPTPRIGLLEAANKEPTFVNPSDNIRVATTLMQLHDYSQLPVVTSRHSLKGIISWKSIGARLSHGNGCELVEDCMETANEIPITTPMFDAINTIVEHGYVLVRDDRNAITGIITASDLSSQFKTMTGPFILIGEIEEHLRRLIHRKFTLEKLKNSASDDPGLADITGAADLTFGNYCRLLQNPDNWRNLNLNIDRAAFTKRLDRVRYIRNDVMHFNPEGLDDSDTMELLDMARFFQNLVRMGAV